MTCISVRNRSWIGAAHLLNSVKSSGGTPIWILPLVRLGNQMTMKLSPLATHGRAPPQPEWVGGEISGVLESASSLVSGRRPQAGIEQ
jgi:hypothetical protein